MTGKHWNKSYREFYLRTRHANISAMAWGSLVAFKRSSRLPNNLPDLWWCARTSWALHSGCGNVIQDLVKATCLKNRFFSIYIHKEVFKQGGSQFKNITKKEYQSKFLQMPLENFFLFQDYFKLEQKKEEVHKKCNSSCRFSVSTH